MALVDQIHALAAKCAQMDKELDEKLSNINVDSLEKPYTDYKADSSTIDTTKLQDNAIVVTDDEVKPLPMGFSRNVGELVYSLVPLTDPGLHLLDGSLLSENGVYAEGIAKIVSLQSTHPNLFVSESDWQASITSYGVCGKFVWDSEAGTLRLPKVTGFVEGTLDSTALGDLVEAGLPNITGSVYAAAPGSPTENRYIFSTATGAFTSAGNSGLSKITINEGSSGGTRYGSVSFDASDSDPTYGNSTTVQPQAIKEFLYIVLANVAKSSTAFDLEQYVESKYQPVYVNGTTGDDINDGLTSETAVKTIQRGIQLAATRSRTTESQAAVRVFIAPGTYDENVTVRTRVFLILSGHTTITGTFEVSHSSFCEVVGDGTLTSTNCSLTINKPIIVTRSSEFVCTNQNIPISTCSIQAKDNSYVILNTKINLSYNSDHPTNEAINVADGTYFGTANSTITINGTGYPVGIRIQRHGHVVFGKNSVFNMTSAVSTTGIALADTANLFSIGAVTVRGVSGIVLDRGSSAMFYTGSITIIPSTGVGIQTINHSNFISQSTSITISPSATATRALQSDTHSNMNLGSCTLKVTGAYSSDILSVANSSMFYIGTGATISGSPTGRRYWGVRNSTIYTSGGGANRLPGSTAGTVDATSVYA